MKKKHIFIILHFHSLLMQKVKAGNKITIFYNSTKSKFKLQFQCKNQIKKHFLKNIFI
jgi:hypothetical protein